MLFYVLLFCPSKVKKEANPHVVLGLEAFWPWLHWPKFTHYKIHAVPLWSVFSTDMSIPSNKLIPMLSWVYRPLVLGAMAPGVCVIKPRNTGIKPSGAVVILCHVIVLLKIVWPKQVTKSLGCLAYYDLQPPLLSCLLLPLLLLVILLLPLLLLIMYTHTYPQTQTHIYTHIPTDRKMLG